MAIAVVVDDNPIETLLTRKALEKRGFTVISADSGESALELLRSTTPDLVICDITMPGISGLELLDITRSFDPPPPFIMFSGLDDVHSAVESLHRGAYSYLTKPLVEDKFNQAIDETLTRHAADRLASSHLHDMSSQDPLTGLQNRDGFMHKLTQLYNTRRQLDLPCAVLMLNIDGLHYVNLNYGQKHGDYVLQHVARFLNASVRLGDIVSRFGGDIFAILLKSVDQQGVDAKAHAILSSFEKEKIPLPGKELSLTLTIGAAAWTHDLDAGELVNNADFALRHAKQTGRNRIYLYAEEDDSRKHELRAEFDFLSVVKQAVEEKRFEMLYQPIVDLQTGLVKHYEALVRFIGVNGEFLPPADLIKTAENFGLIVRLDCLIVAACFKKASDLALDGHSDITLSVNLSGKSVGDDILLEVITQELKQTGINPAQIIFEITETAMFLNLDIANNFVRKLKQMGFKFAMDDFGVGFSSFYYIKQFEIDYLKLDGLFIRNVLDSQNDQAFVRAMVEISRVYGMKVIAEWVENAEIAEILKQFRVDYGQGYHFGKPGKIAY